MTFLANGIQTQQYGWNYSVENKEAYVKKINFIWPHSIRVSWSTYDLFSRPS